ncbi:MAG: serine/threonine-protein kinase, partial [Gemmataceae bacterium]
MSSATQQRSVHGYTLLQPIGEGSFGVVWKALAPGEFPAAVKFISRARDDLIALPELKALQAVRTLNSPYIVKVFACWEETDWLIIAMELADANLRERFDFCRQQGQDGIPADELLHYTREAADALDYLHGLNKLHRDIKPENLLLFLGTPAHCKVGDCGLVRDQDRIATMRPQGSPPFMPPEAWDCRPCPASDQFALAVTYAEMRLGRRPFTGKNIREIEEAVRMHDPDLGGMFRPEADAVRKALAKSPADRYPSCRDFVVAIEGATLTRADAYRPKEPVPIAKEPPPRSRVPTREEEKGATSPAGSTALPPTLVPPTPTP